MDFEFTPTFELEELRKKIDQEIADRQPRTTTIYLYRDKEFNYETAAELELSDSATANFKYAAYEVAMTLEVDRDGTSFATHIDGVALTEKVKMS